MAGLPVWPVTLPQAHKLGSSHRRLPNVISAATGAGTTKLRRTHTDAHYRYSDRLVFTTAELATFWTFFETTIAGGSLPFDWIDPRDGVTKGQIILEAPEFREVAPDVWEGIGRFEVGL